MNDATEENKSSNKSRTWLERLTALLAREPKNREQLTAVLRDAEERDVLSSDVLSMIERILLVSEMQVREVMVPKAQMVVVRKDSKLDKILPIVIESGHSRFPVVDVTSKDVVGMLLAKDFLKYLFQQGQQDFSMNNIIRPVIFVPQSKRLDILLREFRVNRNHIAIFSDDEFDTIGGIVLQNFGHLPKRGEIIKIHSLRFKVLHADNRRLYLLEVKVSKTKKRE